MTDLFRMIKENIALALDSCNIFLAHAIFSCILLNASQYKYLFMAQFICDSNLHIWIKISASFNTITFHFHPGSSVVFWYSM